MPLVTEGQSHFRALPSVCIIIQIPGRDRFKFCVNSKNWYKICHWLPKGKAVFPGFSLCLYYNTDLGHVKKNCTGSPFQFIIRISVPRNKSLAVNGSDPSPGGGRSISSWYPSSPDTAFLADCHPKEILSLTLSPSVAGGWSLLSYSSCKSGVWPLPDIWSTLTGLPSSPSRTLIS